MDCSDFRTCKRGLPGSPAHGLKPDGDRPDGVLTTTSLADPFQMDWHNLGAFNVADGVTVRWRTYSNAANSIPRNLLHNEAGGTLSLDGTASFLAVLAQITISSNHGLNLYNAGTILKTGSGASQLQLTAAGVNTDKYFENTGTIHVADAGGTLNWKLVTLAGDLVVNLGSFSPARSDTFTIVDSASGGSITGTFANTPDGLLTLESGDTFEVTYASGGVVLGNFRSAGPGGTILLLR